MGSCTGVCDSGYYKKNTFGYYTCSVCHDQCQTCSGGNNNNCVTCKYPNTYISNGSCLCSTNSSASGNECPCNNGYYSNGSTCSPCAGACATCQITSTQCNSCLSALENASSGLCICNDGYYRNGTTCTTCTYPCATCETSAIICLSCTNTSEVCTCSYGYLGDGITCKRCIRPCDTCVTSITNCVTCRYPQQYQSGGQCYCQDGYFMDGVICRICNGLCGNCVYSSDYCLTCKYGNQTVSEGVCTCDPGLYRTRALCIVCTADKQIIQGIYCICISGYYMVEEVCALCTLPCVTCNYYHNYCTSCSIVNSSAVAGTCICNAGYYSNDTTCLPCVSPCATCITTNNYCLSCIWSNSSAISGVCSCNSGFFEISNNCSQCTAPCATCITSATHCLTCIHAQQTLNESFQCICNSGYMPNGTSCAQCVAPCATCQTNINSCYSCTDVSMAIDNVNHTCSCNYGFVYIIASKSCTPCISPCATCTSTATQCGSCVDSVNMIVSSSACICIDGYYADTITTCAICKAPCHYCDIYGCLSCLDVNQYAQDHECICYPGYFMEGNNCALCKPPCQDCQGSANKCKQCVDVHQLTQYDQCICQPGYFMLGFMCEQCTLPCVECVDDSNTCTNCLDPLHILIGTQCICQDGSLTIGVSCQLCQHPCGNCENSIANCITCLDANIYTLEQNQCNCNPGYYAADEYCRSCSIECGTCELFAWNCLSCSSPNFIFIQNTCICDVGYIQQGDDCIKCTPPCLQCQIEQNQCTSCLDQVLQLTSNGCNCILGYYLTTLFQCEQCNPLCPTCQDINVCYSCIDRYFLDSQLCQPCIPPCLTCSDGLNCNSCRESFTLINYICIRCSPNCQNCAQSEICLVCYSGYFLHNNECYLCDQPCKTCELSSNQCTSCIDKHQALIKNQCNCVNGYYEMNNYCMACQYPCIKCKSIQMCDMCASLTNLILMEDNQCSCKSGYFYNQQSVSCDDCSASCKTCFGQSNFCISCDSAQFRLLRQNNCDCLDNYVEKDGKCLSCKLAEVKYEKLCIYNTIAKECTDGVWIQGEQCNDGNSVSRDGCSNCKVDPGYSCINKLYQSSVCYKCQKNCHQCSYLNSETQCTQCQVGYYLFNGSCEKCHDSCQVCTSLSQCLICSVEQLAPINGKCQECLNSQGMYLNEQFECLPKCGDYIQTATEECDDGNLLNNDGCSDQCLIEKKFDCSQGTCEQFVADEKIILEYLDQTTKNIIVLRCDIPIDCQSIKVRIEQFTETEFEFQVLLIEEQQCQIDFTFKKTITEMNLIHLSFQTYESGRILNEENIREVVIVPRKEIYATESQRDMAVQAVAAQDKLGTTLYVVAPMAILIGGLNVFMSILDIMTWINNLYFINVYYPENANQVFVNSIWGQTNEIASPFILNDINDDYYLASPPRFLEKGVDSMFINNVWLSAYMLIAVVLAYLICRSLNWLIDSITKKNQIIKRVNQIVTVVPPQNIKKSKYKQLVNSVQNKLQSYCQTIGSTLVTMINLSLLDFTMASVLQISVAKKYNPNQPILFVNIILALFTIICILITIQLAYNVSTKAAKQLKSQTYNLYYGSFYKHINVESRIGRLYSVCNLLRKVLFIVSLIVFYDIPLMQVYFCGIVTFSNVALIIWENPFISIRHLIQYGVPDVCLFVLLMICSLLAVDDKISYLNSDQRFTIGWIIISLICVSIATQVFFMLQEWYINFKEYAVKLKEYCNKQKKSRVGSADII